MAHSKEHDTKEDARGHGGKETKASATKADKRPLRTFRLLAGQHIQGDENQKPVTTLHPLTGDVVSERFPSKTYLPGQVVPSRHNLVEAFGPAKFVEVRRYGRGYAPIQEEITEEEDVTLGLTEEGESYTPGQPTPLNRQAPLPNPHGQVSEGHPATSGTPEEMIGTPTAGVSRQFAQTPQEAKAMAVKHADRLPEPPEDKPKNQGKEGVTKKGATAGRRRYGGKAGDSGTGSKQGSGTSSTKS